MNTKNMAVGAISLVASTLAMTLSATGTAAAADSGPASTAAASTSSAVPGNTLRAGLYYVLYNVKASDLNGPYVPAGVNLDVKNLVTPYFAYLRRLNSHFALELAVGLPPTAKTVGKGPATLGSVPFNGVEVSSAKWIAPTLLLAYSFRDESAVLRPYVELGVNYTHFYDLQSTAAGNQANGGPTAISLKNSVGPVGTVGFVWKFRGPWSLDASYSVSQVTSDYAGNTAGVIRTTHVKFNPTPFVVAVGYTF